MRYTERLEITTNALLVFVDYYQAQSKLIFSFRILTLQKMQYYKDIFYKVEQKSSGRLPVMSCQVMNILIIICLLSLKLDKW